MAGIYGNSPEDRYREKQLDDYLDSQEIPTCNSCGDVLDEDSVSDDEEGNLCATCIRYPLEDDDDEE